MNPEWVRIRSWHVLVPTRALPFRASTRCGRVVEAPVIETDMPPGKTCETCLRLIAWDAERTAT